MVEDIEFGELAKAFLALRAGAWAARLERMVRIKIARDGAAGAASIANSRRLPLYLTMLPVGNGVFVRILWEQSKPPVVWHLSAADDDWDDGEIDDDF